MPSPLFKFFEVVAEELCSQESRVLTRSNLQVNEEQAPLLDDLRRELSASSTEKAMRLATQELKNHFKGKGSPLPFDYNPQDGRFTAVDTDFLNFVKAMKEIRTLRDKSRDFECGVAERLARRATGSIHRVGDPRDVRRTRVDFNDYLQTLGFDGPVLRRGRGDGGFDILWLLPVGTIPHRPIVSVQCKNSEFNVGDADKSVAAGRRSFSKHGGLQPQVHVPCVLFNDYICPENLPESLTQKQMDSYPSA
ncbi:MAG: hypothetical protein HY313_07850 [Acidobacteria bacterium]|nr:hypothetical protein [Acidobacteriota bacterium]